VIAARVPASTASGWRLAVRSDSPPASWYEAPDDLDDDDRPEAAPEPEPWVVTHGWATWTHSTDDAD
jgi:hypothetical protein